MDRGLIGPAAWVGDRQLLASPHAEGVGQGDRVPGVLRRSQVQMFRRTDVIAPRASCGSAAPVGAPWVDLRSTTKGTMRHPDTGGGQVRALGGSARRTDSLLTAVLLVPGGGEHGTHPVHGERVPPPEVPQHGVPTAFDDRRGDDRAGGPRLGQPAAGRRFGHDLVMGALHDRQPDAVEERHRVALLDPWREADRSHHPGVGVTWVPATAIATRPPREWPTTTIGRPGCRPAMSANA